MQVNGNARQSPVSRDRYNRQRALLRIQIFAMSCGARALIDEQINPNEHKKTAKAQAYAAANVEAEQVKTTTVQTYTVQDLATAWLVHGGARKDGNAELQRRFNKDLLQALAASQKYDGIRPLKKETQLALWISLGTPCRMGELLQAE